MADVSRFDAWREACAGLLQRPCRAAPPRASALSSFPHIFSRTETEPVQAPPAMPSAEEVDDWSQHVETEEEFQRRIEVEKWGAALLANSPMIRFMTKHLAVIGCNPLDQSDEPVQGTPKIAVGPCPPTIAGGFSPAPPGRPPSESSILICSNRIQTKKHLEDTLAHEMVHWWDNCRFKVDWNDLRQHACSEVRAASLSGDCRWGRELRRLHFGVVKQHQECARRRAILSIMGNPACKGEEHAKQVVDDVFQSCFNDTRPFDEIY